MKKSKGLNYLKKKENWFKKLYKCLYNSKTAQRPPKREGCEPQAGHKTVNLHCTFILPVKLANA